MTQKKTWSASQLSIISLTIVAVISVISITVCCLAALGYNSRVTMEKEKIEVNATNSNLEM